MALLRATFAQMPLETRSALTRRFTRIRGISSARLATTEQANCGDKQNSGTVRTPALAIRCGNAGTTTLLEFRSFSSLLLENSSAKHLLFAGVMIGLFSCDGLMLKLHSTLEPTFQSR